MYDPFAILGPATGQDTTRPDPFALLDQDEEEKKKRLAAQARPDPFAILGESAEPELGPNEIRTVPALTPEEQKEYEIQREHWFDVLYRRTPERRGADLLLKGALS